MLLDARKSLKKDSDKETYLNSSDGLWFMLDDNSFEEIQESESSDYEDKRSLNSESSENNTIKRRLNLFQSGVNMAISATNITIVQMPSYMQNFGLILSTVIFLFTYLMMLVSAKLLTQAKILSQRDSYQKISLYCFGEYGFFVHISLFLNSFGLSITYLMIYFEIIDNLLVNGFGTTNPFLLSTFTQLLFAILITLPWIFTSSVKKLRILSYFSILCYVLLIIVSFPHIYSNLNSSTKQALFINLHTNHEGQNFNVFPDVQQTGIREILTTFPIIFFGIFYQYKLIIYPLNIAFGYQFNFYPIYKSLDNPTPKRVYKMAYLSLLFPFIVYFLVAILGYTEYRNINPNFLLSLVATEMGQLLYSTIYIAFLIVILSSFPLRFYQGRNVLLWMVKVITTKEKSFSKSRRFSKTNHEDFDKKEELTRSQYIITIVYYIIVVVIAMLDPGVQIIFSLIAIFGGGVINLILPGLFYLKSLEYSATRGLSEGKNITLYVWSYISVIFGIIVGLVSLITILFGWL